MRIRAEFGNDQVSTNCSDSQETVRSTFLVHIDAFFASPFNEGVSSQYLDIKVSSPSDQNSHMEYFEISMNKILRTVIRRASHGRKKA